MPRENKTYRDENGLRIPGTFIQAFIHNVHYYVVEIKIYKDGMIDCWGLVNFEEFKEKVKRGWVVTQIPEGSRATVASQIHFNVSNVKSFIEESEFIKEVEDEIRDLNDQATSLDLCKEALNLHKLEQTEVTKNKLREAYLAVPKHNRKFLGTMDDKDSEYRTILGIFYP